LGDGGAGVEPGGRVFRLHRPPGDTLPLLFESPHSGRDYPDDFASALPLDVLRRAEDAYVDELLADAPAAGATVLAALFPRSYIDVNRADDDLDPALLAEPWPRRLRPGAKSAAGIGLVRRIVTPEHEIYDRQLSLAEVRHRLDTYWRPYRERLETRVGELARAHGRLLVVQWHSMKSHGNAATPDGPGARRPDIVLGDRHGRSALAAVVAATRALFEAEGFTVAINQPYAGTAMMERLCNLGPNVAALQIELNRALYLDEERVTPHAGFDDLQRQVAAVTRGLADLARRGW